MFRQKYNWTIYTNYKLLPLTPHSMWLQRPWILGSWRVRGAFDPSLTLHSTPHWSSEVTKKWKNWDKIALFWLKKRFLWLKSKKFHCLFVLSTSGADCVSVRSGLTVRWGRTHFLLPFGRLWSAKKGRKFLGKNLRNTNIFCTFASGFWEEKLNTASTMKNAK